MNDTTPSGGLEARDIHARNVISGIQQNFTVIFQQPFQPPADLAQLRADYLAYLADCYRCLDMKGVMQVQQVMQQLPLAAVYIPLKATGGPAGPGHFPGRVAGRAWPVAGDEAALSEAALGRQAAPVLIEAALQADPAVVVLGDPGAGKSTLLKVLALALAEQPDGPLPILLPLNAYARRLQQEEVNLAQFLGEYYAGRQQKLSRAGELFQAALKNGQAVVLLDGLDEVQANRQHLVRLVQDFATENMPNLPAGTGKKDRAAVRGNRVIVTSRIVGYEEAPLAGRQWRAYTLTDFNRADIEQFIGQWTLAFATSLQGDTGPARQAAAIERQELLEAIFSRPSVERLAANPLLLTILALIKYTGVTLPEQRVKLYELYLEALIESWNRGRSLDQYPVGPDMNYEETVQVLAPLALWLRRENPTAGLVGRDRLESWLTDYFHGPEWGLPRGEARQRGREFVAGVQRYSNLLLERGERQYGFLHLTLEEMLAAKGIAQVADDDLNGALEIFETYLPDPAWAETLQLAVGAIGIVQQRPKTAGLVLQRLLDFAAPGEQVGRPVVFAGEALLDMGQANVSRPAALKVTAVLQETMQSSDCPIRTRRDAGDLLGRLGWTPEPEPGDLLPALPGADPDPLDAFRPVPGLDAWLGKYPVTNRQFARFIKDGGYDRRECWSDEGWIWRTGRYDSKAPKEYQDWLKKRPPEKRDRPYFWEERRWNSPLYPVVGITWFEAEAYGRWLTGRISESANQRISEARQAVGEPTGQEWASGRIGSGPGETENEVLAGLAEGRLVIRLPQEQEWEAAVGGWGEYAWGDQFDPARLNCADSWAGQDLSDFDELRKWWDSESSKEAGLTAVSTYPLGASQTGIWDSCGNIWEWSVDRYGKQGNYSLRGGSWNYGRRLARVSSRFSYHPDGFYLNIGIRLVVAPVLS